MALAVPAPNPTVPIVNPAQTTADPMTARVAIRDFVTGPSPLLDLSGCDVNVRKRTWVTTVVPMGRRYQSCGPEAAGSDGLNTYPARRTV